MQFIKNIQNFSAQHDLWQKCSKIMVGVSGGPDSVCLLEVLVFLAKKYDFELQIAHVNHGLRGKDSLEDEKFVQELGKKYELDVNVLKTNKNQYKGNLENSLREIRYAYFEKLRKQFKFDFIAVAHNQNDQAETVLMKIFRGAGLNGLSGMRPKNGKIIRPLLQTNRAEIMAYLKEKKLNYCIDKSNEQTDFMRNKIRHEALPYLEKEFNPSLVKNLSALAFSVADDYAFLEKRAEKFVNSIYKEKKIVFEDSVFLNLPQSIQRQAIRQIFVKLLSQAQDVEYGHIEEFRKVIKSSKSKTKVAKIGGLKISKKGAKVEIFC